MPRITVSSVLSTEPQKVWQVLNNFDAWPEYFMGLVRVTVVDVDSSTIELDCLDARGKHWREKNTERTINHSLTMAVASDTPHPLKITSFTWLLDYADKKTTLTLHCDYNYRVAKFLDKLSSRFGTGRHASIQRHCDHALNAVVHQAHQQTWSYQENVQTILNRKGNDVISVLPSDVVSVVCDKIFTHRIGAVLVLDSMGQLAGLVSERDVVYQLSQHGPSVLEQRVDTIMTRNLIVCEPSSDLLFVMACMTQNKVRHLPVVDDGILRGVISIGDVVQQRLQSLEIESETMREYIAAREWRYHSHHDLSGAEVAPQSPIKN